MVRYPISGKAIMNAAVNHRPAHIASATAGTKALFLDGRSTEDTSGEYIAL
jgi:hypothetical protein